MSYVYIVLKGFSHLFFQENILLGVLIVLGLGIASLQTLLLAIIGNVVGLIISIFLNVKRPVVELGIFGFNGVLIGCMVSFYIKQLAPAIIITIVASALGAIIFYLFFRNNIPALAAPFVLIGWGILILLKFLKL